MNVTWNKEAKKKEREKGVTYLVGISALTCDRTYWPRYDRNLMVC